jgi:hypothetical protein
VRIEDLTPAQRELLTEALRDDRVSTLRVLIALPLTLALALVIVWFFIVGDDTGFGRFLAWPFLLAVSGGVMWMLVAKFTNRRVRWVLQSFELGPEGARVAGLAPAPPRTERREP